MKFHNITTADIMNGDGLRTVLWLSGCEMKCKGCQNPQTWDPDDGVEFDDIAKEELFSKLSEDYIAGITFSGGHPLHEANCQGVLSLIKEIREKFPNKNIWLYTGYTLEDVILKKLIHPDDEIAALRYDIIKNCDVIVDGSFIESKLDANYHWAGSTNQKVIDIKPTFENIDLNKVVDLYNDNSEDTKPEIMKSFEAYQEESERCMRKNHIIRASRVFKYILDNVVLHNT